MVFSQLTGCRKPSSAEHTTATSSSAQTAANSSGFVSYSKDGISLTYPEHWQLAYDESPSIYASRGIGFDASEFSSANVYVYEQIEKPIEYLTRRYLKEFNLNLKNSIENFKRSPIDVGGFTGEQITWTDTEICCSTFEVSVFQIQEEPKTVLVSFILSDEDIKAETAYKKRFLTNIQFN